MIKKITIRDVDVWITIDKLVTHQIDDRNVLVDTGLFVSYFKFVPPPGITYGEVVLHPDGYPRVFETIEGAIVFTTEYVQVNFNI